MLTATVAMVAQEPRRVAPFTSIEVSGGAHVTVQPAPRHGVRLIRGSMDLSRVSVNAGGELVIDKCVTKCPKGYVLEVEVFAPAVARISVAHGGRIESRPGFARQSDLVVAVEHGGTIDVRSIDADVVTASVYQGGGILTIPRASLTASVAQGGNITYWGDPRVKSSIDHPGAVQRAVN